jgi:hypothetical protein
MYSTVLDIEAAICTQQEGQEMMNWSTSIMVGRSMGIDVAWGNTSKFAIVITQHRNRNVEVFYAETYEKPQTNTLMSKRIIKIHPSLQKLIVSLRTAVVSDEWKLDKQQTSYNDVLDSLRLALCNYELPKYNSCL